MQVFNTASALATIGGPILGVRTDLQRSVIPLQDNGLAGIDARQPRLLSGGGVKRRVEEQHAHYQSASRIGYVASFVLISDIQLRHFFRLVRRIGAASSTMQYQRFGDPSTAHRDRHRGNVSHHTAARRRLALPHQ